MACCNNSYWIPAGTPWTSTGCNKCGCTCGGCSSCGCCCDDD